MKLMSTIRRMAGSYRDANEVPTYTAALHVDPTPALAELREVIDRTEKAIGCGPSVSAAQTALARNRAEIEDLTSALSAPRTRVGGVLGLVAPPTADDVTRTNRRLNQLRAETPGLVEAFSTAKGFDGVMRARLKRYRDLEVGYVDMLAVADRVRELASKRAAEEASRATLLDKFGELGDRRGALLSDLETASTSLARHQQRLAELVADGKTDGVEEARRLVESVGRSVAELTSAIDVLDQRIGMAEASLQESEKRSKALDVQAVALAKQTHEIQSRRAAAAAADALCREVVPTPDLDGAFPDEALGRFERAVALLRDRLFAEVAAGRRRGASA